jgi:parallel beta-helix repeat protein
LTNITIKNFKRDGIYITAATADTNISITGGTIQNITNSALDDAHGIRIINANHNTVTGTTISGILNDGIYAQGDSNTFTSLVISNVSDGGDGDGIQAAGDDITISHCAIDHSDDLDKNGIILSGAESENSLIEDNEIIGAENCMNVEGSGSIVRNNILREFVSIGIYIETTSGEYHENIITTDSGTVGMLQDKGTGNIISNNVIDGVSLYGLRLTGEASCTFRNNILNMPASTSRCVSTHADWSGGLTSDYNLFWPTDTTWFYLAVVQSSIADYRTVSGQDANSSVADPLFRDAVNSDFHLSAASPAIGSGYGGLDIGAYPAGFNRGFSAVGCSAQ